MKKANEIIIDLNNIEQLLVPVDSLFYPDRRIAAVAEEFISEKASALPYRAPVYLKVYLSSEAVKRSDEIESAIHQHFAYLRKKSEIKLKQTLRLGWKSLLISILFLSFLISVTMLARPVLPQGGLFITFREILAIIGWVALWRPVDILLYEWRPFRREVNLFSRLENSCVELYPGSDKFNNKSDKF